MFRRWTKLSTLWWESTLQHALYGCPQAQHPVAPCFVLAQNQGTGQGPGLLCLKEQIQPQHETCCKSVLKLRGPRHCLALRSWDDGEQETQS